MTERDFDQFFSDKLNEDAEFPRRQAVWQKIKDKQQSGIAAPLPPVSAGNGWQRWLPLSLLLLLGLLNGWQWWQMGRLEAQDQAAKRAIETLKTALTQNKSLETTRVFDTIVQTRVIFRTDTIYRRVVVVGEQGDATRKNDRYTEGVVLEKNAQQTVEKNQNRTSSPTGASTIAPQTPSAAAKSVQSAATQGADNAEKKALHDSEPPKQAKNNVITPQDTASVAQSMVVQDVEKNKISSQDSARQANAAVKPAPKPTPVDSFEKALEKRPNAMNAESSAKKTPILRPLSIEKRIGLVSGVSRFGDFDDDVNVTKQLGVVAELGFNSKLRLGLMAEGSVTHFDIKDRFERHLYYLNLPDSLAVEPGYNLTKVEGTSFRATLNPYFSYYFLPKSRVRPFVSAGYVYRVDRPFEAEYEYTKPGQNDVEIRVRQERFRRRHMGSLGVGLDARVYRNWEARLRADFTTEFNRRDYSNQWILRGGILYRF